MALVAASLVGNLSGIFESPPLTVEGCAEAWAEAMFSYSALLTPPVSPPVAAQAALTTQLVSIFSAATSAPVDPNVAALRMEEAWYTFAVSLGAGMLPPFTASPANIPLLGGVGFSTLFEERPDTTLEAAQNVGNAIDSWMRTGTAVNSTTSVTVPWT